jgi:hypothetical protein
VLACPLPVKIAENDHADVGEAGEVLQIGIADHAGADEPDPYRTRY